MKYNHTLSVGCLLFFILVSEPPTGEAHGSSSDKLKRAVENYLRPFEETNNFTGVICVTRRDLVEFQGAYGMADYQLGIPNSPDTRFHIASISKAFTAAAILLLEEKGALSVSDPLSRFIPDYPNGNRIHIKDLLRHCSGIPNVNQLPEYDRKSRLPHTVEQIVAMFKNKPLKFEPGSQYRYSNSDYNLLALIIEKASGMSYAQFLKKSIYSPLELSSVEHDEGTRKITDDCAVGTEPQGLRDVKLASPLDWSIKTGNGSLVATAADLCRFANALFTGKLLKPSSLAKIFEPGPSFPYGWSSEDRFSRKLMRAEGRSPGFVASLEYFPMDSISIAILTNSYSSVAQVIAPDISAIVFGQGVAAPPVAYITPREEELSAFTGKFKMPNDYYLPGATLTLRDSVRYLEAAWNDGSITIIYPAGGDNFVDRTYWAQVHFVRNPNGAISGFMYNLLKEFVANKIGR